MIRRLIMTCLAVVILVITAAPAVAQEDLPPVQDTATGTACTSVPDVGQYWLPSWRWAGGPAGRFHMRLGADYPDQVMSSTARTSQVGSMLTIGDGGWMAAITLTETAAIFCPGDRAARYLDGFVGDLWSSITSTGLVAGLVATGVVVGLWQLWRRRSPREAVKVLAAVAALSMMGMGAAASTPDYSAPFSPSWVANGASHALGSVIALPTMAFNSAADSMTGNPPTSSKLDCRRYTGLLAETYELIHGPAGSLPMALDGMWRAGQMNTWTLAQFGTNNDLGPKVSCWLLEWNRGGDPGFIRDTMSSVGGIDAPAMGSMLVTPRSDSERDAALVAMAACTWTGSQWEMDPAFAGVTNRGREFNDETVPAACEAVWSNTGSDARLAGLFDFGASETEINQATPPSSEARDFLLALHGYGPDQTAVAVASAIGGAYVGIALGILALTVIVARLALVVVGLYLAAALIAELVPGISGRALAVARLWFEAAVIVVGSGLLLAMAATLTAMLHAASKAMYPSPLAGAMWGAACPILALLMIHLAFKGLGKASPLTISGAVHYANATHLLGARAESRVRYYEHRAKDYVNPMTHGGFGNPDRRPVVHGQVRAERANGMQIDGPESHFSAPHSVTGDGRKDL